jgi:hypothetical protein
MENSDLKNEKTRASLAADTRVSEGDDSLNALGRTRTA